MEPHHPGPVSAGVIKRIRQACANCRRRKIKCSGERPICTHCRQNRRSCVYEPYSISAKAAHSNGDNAPMPTINLGADLLDRIATIETALSRLSQGTFAPHVPALSTLNFEDLVQQPPPPDAENELVDPIMRPSEDPIDIQTDLSAKNDISFNQFPPAAILRTLLDTYFDCMHNQPYSFFHKPTFYQSLENNSLPRCLIFAIMGLAVRFSNDSYFTGRVREASDAYSKQSWLCVLEDHLSIDDNMNLHVIQTVAILSLIDHTAGRISSGWLRLGLAIRLSQDMDLMLEPPTHLTAAEREERRRTFWSIYLVDKLMSCARSRPTAISDHDCTLQLPCQEDAFEKGEWKQTASLHEMLSWDTCPESPTSLFGLTMVTASIFGRCTKYARGRTGTENLPPWDPKSDFTATNASLLLLESHLIDRKGPILDVIRSGLQEGDPDEKQLGHFVFAHALFHLCHCLLNHPFLIRLQLKPIAARAPSSFASHAFRLAQDHARKLTDLLTACTEDGVSIKSSFYSYCTTVAAGIHILSFGAHQRNIKTDSYDAQKYFQRSIDALETLAGIWPMVNNMLAKLREFEPQAEVYGNLFDVKGLADEIEPASEDLLWTLVDYGMLAKEGPKSSPPSLSFLSNLPSPNSWNLHPDHFTLASPPTSARNELLFTTADGNQISF